MQLSQEMKSLILEPVVLKGDSIVTFVTLRHIFKNFNHSIFFKYAMNSSVFMSSDTSNIGLLHFYYYLKESLVEVIFLQSDN